MFRVFSLADEKTAIRRGYMPLLSGLLLFISQWNWQLLTEVGFTHWNIRATSKWKPRIEIIKTNKNCYNNLYQKLMIASLMVVDNWYLTDYMIKLSYMSIRLHKMSFYTCNFTNRNFTNVCKNETWKVIFNNILSMLQSESFLFFEIIDSFINANNQKKKTVVYCVVFTFSWIEQFWVVSLVILYILVWEINSAENQCFGGIFHLFVYVFWWILHHNKLQLFDFPVSP